MAAKKKKPSKTPVDWDSVEPVYRANQLSLREMGNQFDCSAQAIDQYAKKQGWKRDLTSKVKAAIDRELVDASIDKNQLSTTVNDNEIVTAAASQAVAVIQLQRADLKQLRELEHALVERINSDEENTIVSFKDGEFFEHKVKQGLYERSKTLRELATIRHKRISIERLAWNIDGKEGARADSVQVFLDI